METFFEALGLISLILLAGVGLLAGYLAGRIAGRNMALYLAVGVIAAIATPFILAAVGISVLAVGGLLFLLVVGAVGALIVLALVRAIAQKGR